MGNHFHLLVDTTRAHMSAGMHYLQHTFAKRFNKRYGRRGCLFEGRFTSTWIRDEDHYANALEYIRQNPVRRVCVSGPKTGRGPRWPRYRNALTPVSASPTTSVCTSCVPS